ncbi:MAG: hypothetical protein IPM24_24960 [Bryobacterales bacterium]|nr:hypothetical protein [Bryobacterales bacterium]
MRNRATKRTVERTEKQILAEIAGLIEELDRLGKRDARNLLGGALQEIRDRRDGKDAYFHEPRNHE